MDAVRKPYLSGRSASAATPDCRPRASVAEAVQHEFGKSPYPPLRSLRFDFHEGVLTLRGCLPNFYLVQVAQTIAQQVEGVEEVTIRIDVAYPGND